MHVNKKLKFLSRSMKTAAVFQRTQNRLDRSIHVSLGSALTRVGSLYVW